MRFCALTLMAMAIPGMVAATEPEPTQEKTPAVPTADTALLGKKLTELKELQAEIQQLRKRLGSEQQLLVRVQMFEASPKRFNEAGEALNSGGVVPTLIEDEPTESKPQEQQLIKVGTMAAGGHQEKLLEQWRYGTHLF